MAKKKIKPVVTMEIVDLTGGYCIPDTKLETIVSELLARNTHGEEKENENNDRH